MWGKKSKIFWAFDPSPSCFIHFSFHGTSCALKQELVSARESDSLLSILRLTCWGKINQASDNLRQIKKLVSACEPDSLLSILVLCFEEKNDHASDNLRQINTRIRRFPGQGITVLIFRYLR